MSQSRPLKLALLVFGAIFLMGTAPALADEARVEELKARRAAVEAEMQAIDEELANEGVEVLTHGGRARYDDGRSLLYSGTVELGAGWTWADCDELNGGGNECPGPFVGDDLDDGSYPYIEGSGRASVPVAENWAIQIDAEGWATFTERGGSSDSEIDIGEENLQTYFTGALHGTWRDPENGAAGVFVQAGSANGGEDENGHFWLLGVEGQIYLDDFTFYGQAGYFEADDESEDNVITDAYFLRAVARWFADPDTRIQGEFAYVSGEENASTGDFPPASDLHGYSWGLRVDRAITDHPISLFAAYEGLMMSEDESVSAAVEDETDYMEHRFLAGVTFHFGVEDLFTQDRRGTTLDTPDVGRWIGSTLEILD